jgi:hypothetical protein
VIPVILIRGGLTAGVAGHATVGREFLVREDGETPEAFQARAVTIAKAVGEESAVIGGLPE